MKKLYTFAMAAAVTLTAAANTRQQAVPFPKSAEAVLEIPALPVTALSANAVDFKTVADVAGDYDWSYTGLLNGDSGAKTAVVTIKVLDAATGEVAIEGLVSAGTGITVPVKGKVDLAAGTLTVANKQDLGTDSYGDKNYFYFKSANSEGELNDGATDVESVVATISGTTFTFPEMCIFAVGDYNNESLGWWKLTYKNKFTVYETPTDGIDLTEWTEFTTATMIDGWVMPIVYRNVNGEQVYLDANEYPLTVKVAKNNEDPSLILIENPYLQASGFPLTTCESGYIVLDITDPDFVLVLPGVYSGFSNGANRVYCMNLEAFYVYKGYSKEVIQASLKDQVTEWSTMKTVDGKSVIDIPNCRFNYPDALDKMYTWNGRADAMKAKFTFASAIDAVEDITVADENAPVEYFNLQGVRVNEPAAGTLVIRRQGTKATKVFVK